MTARPEARRRFENLDTDAVLRAQGADSARLRARSPRLVSVAERALREGIVLLDPRLTCRFLGVRAREPGGIRLEDGGALSGSLVARHLCGSTAVAIVAATIGARLEARVSRAFGLDLPYALALDGLGSCAVQSLSLTVRSLVREVAARAGLRATVPISPGMEGWPLGEGQRELFRLLDAASCCVRLTEAGWMIPRKSLSMVFGLGAAVREDGEICDACAARDSCRRRHGYGPDG